jgi:hypothetical protein
VRKVPWVLVVVLLLYGLSVLGYVWHTYWNSPDYQAAQHYVAALELLGTDGEGRTSPVANLPRAFDLMLEASRLMPDDKGLAVRVERLRWRCEERGVPLSKAQVRKAELVSDSARRAEEATHAAMVFSLRDKGWAPDQLLDGPTRVVWWSLPGLAFIFAVFGWSVYNDKRRRADMASESQRQVEHEIEELGAFRRRIKTAKKTQK